MWVYFCFVNKFVCSKFYIPRVSDIIWCLSFYFWVTFLSMIISTSIHVANGIISFFLCLSTILFCVSSVAQSCLTLWATKEHARPTCPSPTPGVYSNSCPLSWWCHPTISSSVVPFSSHLQSFPASGSFPMSQLFVSGGQSIGVSASPLALPKNIQDWFPLGWTGGISLQFKGLSRVFSSTTVQKHQFLVLSFLYGPTFKSIHDYWKNHSFD